MDTVQNSVMAQDPNSVQNSGNSQLLFREVQRIGPKWVWAVVLIPAFIVWCGAYIQLVLKKPFGNNPAPDWMMLGLLIVFGILFPLFFRSIKLVTEVRKEGLYIRYYPFHISFREFPFSTIKSYEVRTYSPLRDYGGWGIRYGLAGDAYNASGNRGVLFEFETGKGKGKRKGNGKKLMVGSQIPEELAEAIRAGLKMQGLKETLW